jgi:hypothetical protein
MVVTSPTGSRPSRHLATCARKSFTVRTVPIGEAIAILLNMIGVQVYYWIPLSTGMAAIK